MKNKSKKIKRNFVDKLEKYLNQKGKIKIDICPVIVGDRLYYRAKKNDIYFYICLSDSLMKLEKKGLL